MLTLKRYKYKTRCFPTFVRYCVIQIEKRDSYGGNRKERRKRTAMYYY